MKAVITGETANLVGVNLRDNGGAEHILDIRKNDGEITAHQCKSYADKPKNRTPEENELNEQARRFAQYYVYRERGYDTVRPEIHPERIDAVRVAIQNLSDAEFERLFGEFYQQLQSYHDTSVQRAIPIPSSAAGPTSVLYRQHVYLGVDPLQTELESDAKTLATVHGIDLDTAAESVDELSEAALSDWKAFTDQFETLAREKSVYATDTIELGGVSSLYTAYVDSAGKEHIGEPDEDPFNREPDTLLELAPIDPGSISEFRAFLDHQLKCQIRDCFVRMGVRPPKDVRVLGTGRIEAAEQYKQLELYPDFTDPENQALLAEK